MGALETEIKEIREAIHLVTADKMNLDKAKTLVGLYSQSHKRMQTMLQIHSLAAKYNKHTLNRIVKTNLIGDGQAIDVGVDPEEAKVNCKWDNEPITRAECLDHSGDETFDCGECSHKVVTQNALLGEA